MTWILVVALFSIGAFYVMAYVGNMENFWAPGLYSGLGAGRGSCPCPMCAFRHGGRERCDCKFCGCGAGRRAVWGEQSILSL